MFYLIIKAEGEWCNVLLIILQLQQWWKWESVQTLN
jgi:hypothetical protein